MGPETLFLSFRTKCLNVVFEEIIGVEVMFSLWMPFYSLSHFRIALFMEFTDVYQITYSHRLEV